MKAMSELKHFGVKGMKWGTRRSALETKYIKKGHSQSSSSEMAAKRIKGEKIAAGVIGVVGTLRVASIVVNKINANQMAMYYAGQEAAKAAQKAAWASQMIRDFG